MFSAMISDEGSDLLGGARLNVTAGAKALDQPRVAADLAAEDLGVHAGGGEERLDVVYEFGHEEDVTRKRHMPSSDKCRNNVIALREGVWQVCHMAESTWQDRLGAALLRRTENGSSRDLMPLSFEVGLGRNYLQQYVKKVTRGERPPMPGVDQFLKLCKAAEVSPVWVLTGIEMDEQVEEFLALSKSIPPSDLAHILELAKRLVPAGR
jgi:hypothetical protein